jgi:hypothetical protein
VVAWGFEGTKNQTSNLSIQGTRGTIVKPKKAALGKNVPPTFNNSGKTMFQLNQNQKNTNIQSINSRNPGHHYQKPKRQLWENLCPPTFCDLEKTMFH